MNINTYRKYSHVTCKDLNSKLLNSIHCVLGLTSELLTEYANATDEVNEFEELGDANWFAAEYCNVWGIETPDSFHIHPDIEINVDELTNLLGQLADLDKRLLVYEQDADLDTRKVLILKVWQIIEILTIASGNDGDAARAANIKKLAVRFGDKFDNFLALNRNLAVEFEVLRENK